MPSPSSRRGLWLWVAAVLLMLSTVVYQRRTGPTYPKRGRAEVQGREYRYRLIRSQETSAPARVELPDLGEGELHWRRFPTQDPFEVLPLQAGEGRSGKTRWAELPIQPAAGKLEYWVEVRTSEGPKRLPERETVLLRYKDPVPTPLLLAHVLMMFFGVLLGLRTGLAALFAPGSMERLTAWTLGLMTLGGMVLGPLVQKRAFGAYWTGWPFGGDLTDNKTLLLWGVWLLAHLFLRWGLKQARLRRSVVFAAALVMTCVYLIPHSMRGSQLDYGKVRGGTAPQSAIGTGR